MWHLALIALGGMAGALARYGFSRFVQLSSGDVFPWGTLAVNLSGCLAIGMVYELFDRAVIPSDLRSLVTIGFLGAYTTFSTYSLETINLLRDGELRMLLSNIVINNGLGLMLVVVGMHGARAIINLAR